MMEKHPELANTFEYRELSRMDQSMNQWEKIRFMQVNYPTEHLNTPTVYPYQIWHELA